MLDAPAILVWRVSLVLLEFEGVETHLVDSELSRVARQASVRWAMSLDLPFKVGA